MPHPARADADDGDGDGDGDGGGDVEAQRLCVFDLALSCGHLVTVVLTGWYPVVVPCCDRLGGTILRGDYVAYTSMVDFVNVLHQRTELRPAGTPRARLQIIGRRARKDSPVQSPQGGAGTAGRFPARVGATWSLDGSVATAPAC